VNFRMMLWDKQRLPKLPLCQPQGSIAIWLAV
jgi:hypothetical protein